MIVGHDKGLSRLKEIVEKKAYSHAYLFVGPEKIGKTHLAKHFAKSLLCKQPKDGEPCDNCSSCKLLDLGNQPDFLLFDGHENLNVEEIRNLIHFLELKPYQSQVKVALISHAERMSVSAANSFLKTLEEPAPNTIIILTCENDGNILPTIKSRTQIIRFSFVPRGKIADYLSKKYSLAPDKAEELVGFSAGKIGLATSLAEDIEKTERLKLFLRQFLTVLSKKSYAEAILLAGSLAEEKESLIEHLNFLENYFQAKLSSRQLGDEESLKIVAITGKIAQSKEYIQKNVNPKLALESLLLQGV